MGRGCIPPLFARPYIMARTQPKEMRPHVDSHIPTRQTPRPILHVYTYDVVQVNWDNTILREGRNYASLSEAIRALNVFMKEAENKGNTYEFVVGITQDGTRISLH